TAQSHDLAVLRGVRDPDGPAVGGHHEGRLVAEVNLPDGGGTEDRLAPARRVGNGHDAVVPEGREPPAVGREGQESDRPGARPGPEFGARGGVDQAHQVASAYGDPAAIA